MKLRKANSVILVFLLVVGVATYGHSIWGTSQTKPVVAQETTVSATSRDETLREQFISGERLAVEPVTLAINSVYKADRDTQEAAIAEAEKFMATFANHMSGVLRWEAVTLDPTDFVSGDILQSTSFAEEFLVTPFSDVKFRAKKTKFMARPYTSSATWEGELDDGTNGSIKVSLLGGRENPITIIRIRAGTSSYVVVATNVPDVYVSIEFDPIYWRKIPVG